MGFQLIWSLAHTGHRGNLVEILKSVNYNVTSLTYAEMIKQKQNTTNVSSALQIKQVYMYTIMETQHIMLKEGNVCLKYIYLQYKTWYVPCTHTKGHVFT